MSEKDYYYIKRFSDDKLVAIIKMKKKTEEGKIDDLYHSGDFPSELIPYFHSELDIAGLTGISQTMVDFMIRTGLKKARLHES